MATKPQITGNRPNMASNKKPKLNPAVAQVEQMFAPTADLDPFRDIKYVGDLEKDAAAEMVAMSTGFKERAQQEAARFELATDSEFWFAVAFQSREQKEAFLAAMQWLQNGDKYLNGVALADQMGIDIPQVQLPKPKRVSKRLLELVRK